MAGDPLSDDEAWDEERWEAFLRDNDRRVDRYMDLMFRFMRKHPRPDPGEAEAVEAWKAVLRAFLQDKGWRREDIGLPFLWLEEENVEEDEAEGLFPREDDAVDLEEDPFAGDLEALDRLPVYRHAFHFSERVMAWAHALAGGVKDSTLVQFCSHVNQIAANIAKGYGIGHEREALGGNIACAKRGLSDANTALDLLLQMKRAPYMDEATYRRIYEQAFEVRNQLALYIQDLRDQFNLGID